MKIVELLEKGITPDIIVPMSEADEMDLHRKRIPGVTETLDAKERERVEAVHDVQLERATDVLKGILLYADRTGKPAAKAAPMVPGRPVPMAPSPGALSTRWPALTRNA